MADKDTDSPKQVARARREQQLRTATRGGAAAMLLAASIGGYVVYDIAAHSGDYLDEAYKAGNIEDVATHVARVDEKTQSDFIVRLVLDGRLDAAASLQAAGRFTEPAREQALYQLAKTQGNVDFTKTVAALPLTPGVADGLYAEAIEAEDFAKAEFYRTLKAPTRKTVADALEISIEDDRQSVFDHILASGIADKNTLGAAASIAIGKDRPQMLAALLAQFGTDRPPLNLIGKAMHDENVAAMKILLAHPSFALTPSDINIFVASANHTEHPRAGALDLLLTQVPMGDAFLTRTFFDAAVDKTYGGPAERRYETSLTIAKHLSSPDALYDYLKQNSTGGGLTLHAVGSLRAAGLLDDFFQRAVLEDKQTLARDFLVGVGIDAQDVVRAYAELIAKGYQQQVEWSATQTQTRVEIVAESRQRGIVMAAARFFETEILSDNPAAVAALREAVRLRSDEGILRAVRDAGVTQTDIRDTFMSAIEKGNAPVYIFIVDRLGVAQQTLDEGIDLAFDQGESALVAHALTAGLLTEAALKTKVSAMLKAGKERQAADMLGALDLTPPQQESLAALFDAPMQRALRNQWTPK